MAVVALATTATLARCSESSAPPPPPPPPPSPAAIVVSPDSISIHVSQTVQMHLLALDSTGDTLSVDSVSWTSSDTTILTVSATGLVTAHHYGVAHVAAHLKTLSDSARLRVLVPVASVDIAPSSVTLVPGGNLLLTATVRGADGSILSDRDVQWSHKTTVLSLTPGGAIKALQLGDDTVTATSEGVASWNHAFVHVTRPAFVRVAASEEAWTTCAIAADSTAFCWGGNESGQLGAGMYGDSLGNAPQSPVPGPGIAYPTGVDDLGQVKDIVTNDAMSCAVARYVFCWGVNDEGSLGNWDLLSRNTPGRVFGLGHIDAMESIVAGSEWACALGADSLAYCWGGSVTGFLVPPEQVSTRKYVTLAGGYSTLCAVGADSLAYCGSPSVNSQFLASPSIRFTKLAVGYNHQCGIGTDSLAYCWGQNDQGQLGDTTARHFDPGPVTGGMKFIDIAAGYHFTCGVVAPNGDAYCWGMNLYGVLGQSGPSSNVPVKIPGNIAFSQITSGWLHACALSVTGKVYCWGRNASGQLGDGTPTDRTTPTPVVGQQP